MSTLDSQMVMFAAPWVGILVVSILLLMTRKQLKRTEDRYQRLVQGASVGNLEEILATHIQLVHTNHRELAELKRIVDRQQTAISSAVQHIGIVRFNPFEDTGGQLSFAIALADSQGNGMVMCSLHGRTSTRLYTKPIQAWQSSYPLGEEELEAIRQARLDRTRLSSAADARETVYDYRGSAELREPARASAMA